MHILFFSILQESVHSLAIFVPRRLTRRMHYKFIYVNTVVRNLTSVSIAMLVLFRAEIWRHTSNGHIMLTWWVQWILSEQVMMAVHSRSKVACWERTKVTWERMSLEWWKPREWTWWRLSTICLLIEAHYFLCKRYSLRFLSCLL